MGQGSSRKAFYEDQTSTPAQRVSREPFRVKPHDFGFDPNLDFDKARQLADVLESFETVKKLDS